MRKSALVLLCLIFLVPGVVAEIQNLDRSTTGEKVTVSYTNTSDGYQRAFSVLGEVRSTYPWVYSVEEELLGLLEIQTNTYGNADNFTLQKLTMTALDVENTSLGSDTTSLGGVVVDAGETSNNTLPQFTVSNTGEIRWIEFTLQYKITYANRTHSHTDSVRWDTSDLVWEQRIENIRVSQTDVARGETITVRGTLNFWDGDTIMLEGEELTHTNGQITYAYIVPRNLSNGQYTVRLNGSSSLNPELTLPITFSVSSDAPIIHNVTLNANTLVQGELLQVKAGAEAADGSRDRLNVSVTINGTTYVLEHINTTFETRINTSAWKPGTYVVQVTVHDAAENTTTSDTQTIVVQAASAETGTSEQEAGEGMQEGIRETLNVREGVNYALVIGLAVAAILIVLIFTYLSRKGAALEEEEEKEGQADEEGEESEEGYFAEVKRLEESLDEEEGDDSEKNTDDQNES